MSPAVTAALGQVASALGDLAKALEASSSEQQPGTSSELIPLRALGVPIESARAAIRSEKLRAVKVGRAYFCRRSDLDDWLVSMAVRAISKEKTAPSEVVGDDVDAKIDAALAKGRLRIVRQP